MRGATLKVFDSFIAGTTPVYSQAEFNEALGQSDSYAIQACTTNIASGTTLTIKSETSSDSLNWIETGVTEIDVTGGIANNANYVGGSITAVARFVRFKIYLGASNHQCSLKLYVTTRMRSI